MPSETRQRTIPMHGRRRTSDRTQSELYILGLKQRLRADALRSVTHGSHVVFDWPQPYSVRVVRVLHGRQDVRAHLSSAEEP